MLNIGTITLRSNDASDPVLRLVPVDDVHRVADLIDNARRKRSIKRGGDLHRQQLEHVAAAAPNEELLALDEALTKLGVQEPEKAKLVELRYFGGLTGAQAAAVLGISPTTADRYWTYARAWLQAEVRGR